MSSPDVVAAQARRLWRRMTWKQLGLSFASGLVMIVALNEFGEAVGVGAKDGLVRSLDASVVAPLALVVYALAAAVFSWQLARGDQDGAVKRFALVFTGGLLLVGLAALLNTSHHGTNSGAGSGSSRGGRGRRRRVGSAGVRGLAMAICDPALASAVFGGAPLEGPISGDVVLMRRSSSCRCSGDAGVVWLAVYPLQRAGRSASATPHFSCAIVQDERWLVRVIARATAGHAVDEAALDALAADALARLDGVTGGAP